MPDNNGFWSSPRILWLLFFLVLIFDATGFWGSSFTANAEVPLAVKYTYVAGKGALAAAFAFLLAGVPAGPRAPVKAARRDSGLDLLLILRAFACLLVICGHYFCQVFMVEDFHGLTERNAALRLFMVSPWMGVWIFFSLSGYLMGKGFFSGRYTLTAPDTRRFFANRALRIIPVYAAAVLAVSVLMHPQIFAPQNLWMLVQILVFDSKADLPINPIGALWSVSTEFQFYLMAPFLAAGIYAVHRRCARMDVLIAATLAAGLALRVAGMAHSESAWYSFIYTPFISNLDIFLSGMLLAKIVQDIRKGATPERHPAGTILVCLGALAAAVAVCKIAAFRLGIEGKSADKALLTTLCCALTLLTIYILETTDMKKLSRRFPGLVAILGRVQIIGVLSYCIYVVHEPIYLFFRARAPENLGFAEVATWFPFLFGLVMASAYVTYRLIECRFDELKR
jgi:peptidoglycan/LPS O-acetylase OafA/YrhL